MARSHPSFRRSCSPWLGWACLLAACSATAQGMSAITAPSNWYVMPQASLLDPDNDWAVDDRNGGLGFKAGKVLTPHIDLQMGLSSNKAKDGSNTYKQTLLGVDGLYMFSRSQIRPFLLAGLGAERDARQLAGANVRGTSPYLALGGGLQWMFTPNLGMQFDLRRVNGFLRKDDEFGFKRSGNTYGQLGLVWAFDAPSTPSAPPAPPPPRAEVQPPAPPTPAPVRVAPPPPPPPPPSPPPQRITLKASNLFEFNSAKLRAPQPELDSYAANFSRSAGNDTVVVTGHTDRLGTPAYNQKLSQQRAESVRDHLVSRGVPANRLRAEGRGQSQPVVQCDNKNRAALIACLEPNRRVEVEPITVDKR